MKLTMIMILILWGSYLGLSSNIEYNQPILTKNETILLNAPDSLRQIINSMIWVESNWESGAISKTGDHGLMQINQYYWKHRYDFQKILEPEYNIKAGTEILQCCLESSNGDIEKALKLYNGSWKYPILINNKHKELYGSTIY